MRLPSLNALAIALLFSTSALVAGDDVQIFYLPFSISTYSPVGRSSIKEASFISISLKHTSFPSEILHLIKEGSPVPMNEGLVRLMITNGITVYFFDQHGNGIRGSKSPVSINPTEFEKFISQERINISMPAPIAF